MNRDYDYDDYDCDELEDEPCDCMDPEFDVLEGTLKCWQCGRTEYVTGDRYKDLMAAEVAAHEAHDQAMLEHELTTEEPSQDG